MTLTDNANQIKTLAMLKMEKNFRAHIEKGYLRYPYEDPKQNSLFLICRIEEETKELKEASTKWDMMEEIADISNLCDYLFEKVSNW